MPERTIDAPRDSDALLRTAIEGAPVAMVMVNERGSIVLLNAQAEKLFGYDRRELLGQSIEMLVPQRFREGHPALRGGYHRAPTTRSMGAGRDLYGLRKDGSEVPVEIGLNPVSDVDRQFVVASIIDISERKRTEQARQESEQRYSELVEQSLVGFLLRSPDGKILLVNEAYCRLTGYSRDELMWMNIRAVVSGIDAGVLERTNSLKVGESVWTKAHMLRKDGSDAYIEASTLRLKDGNLQSSVRDITERELAERAREESERRYAELVEQAHEGIVVRSPAGEFLFVNNAFCRMLGYGRPELLDMNIREVVYADDLDTVAQVETLQTGERLQLEKRLRHRDGHTLNVEVNVRRLSNGDFQSTFYDITERKRAELKLRSYAEELRQMSKRVLHAQEDERRRIARELHDEVGQALTAAQIRLRDLEQAAAATPLARSATDIAEIVAGLLQTVRQMSLDLRPSVLDDLGLVSAIRWFVRERVVSRSLEVEVDIQKDLPRFATTLETTVFRVVQSGLANVLRHAQARKVAVSLAEQGGRLVLTIRDDGQGFDLAAARKRAREGGSVGLLGMEERVQLTGGEFAIESKPGTGTTVHVILPLSATERDNDVL